MKVLILYRQHSESASTVEAFIRDFQRRHDASHLQVVDADSREGVSAIDLYGIVNFPAILVLRDDGTIVQSWEGDALPLMDDIAYYTFEG